MINFPGDDQLQNPTGQSFGVFLGSGGAERYGSIDGNSISVINLTASSIVSGTIDASVITVSNINASNISTGTLSADRIGASSITASKIATNAVESNKIKAGAVTSDKINVNTLSAITANLGTVTAGTINGNTINVGGGYGGRIRVYDMGYMEFYNSSGSKRGHIGGASNTLDYDATALHRFYGKIHANDGILVGGCMEANRNAKLKLLNNINMNEYSIDACNTIWAYNFNSRCEVAEGIDPFKVMGSFKPTNKKKSKHWKELDHNQLDEEVYDESEDGVQGYSLNKLVELQRQAILQLKQEVEEIKK